MGPTTPRGIRTLQRDLYRKAKAEPDFRFPLLYDKVLRMDILCHAHALVCASPSSSGGDDGMCAAIAAALRAGTFQPQSPRRPTVQDRVVRTALKIVLEPIFEADLEPKSPGYRPGRGGIEAIKAARRLLCQGLAGAPDIDPPGCFDGIAHAEILHSLAARIVERQIIDLIAAWLRASDHPAQP
jgi:RNA-directed DNA polymerase